MRRSKLHFATSDKQRRQRRTLLEPRGLVAHPHSWKILVEWKPGIIIPVKYLIFLDGSFVTETVSTSFSITGLKSATKYSVTIVSVDGYGFQSNPVSSDVVTLSLKKRDVQQSTSSLPSKFP